LARLTLSVALLAAPAVANAQRSALPRRVLFIGNSYTYVNDLPRMVGALADSAGVELQIDWVTAPGASLEDHWNEGTARRRIAEGGWDVVVLQQGPSSQPEGRRVLREFVGRFAVLIRRAGGRPALYMVWPSRGRQQDTTGVRESYTAAAEAVDGLLFPASEAWRAAWRRDSTLAFYSSDDLHPTLLGSYLTALVMVGQLLGRTPVGLPSRIAGGGEDGIVLEVPSSVAGVVQQAAAEANARYGRR
jgi:hypothetical protein